VIGCNTAPRGAAFGFDGDAGVLWRKTGQTCVEMRDSTLTGQTIHFVTASTPPIIGRARIVGRSTACAALFADSTGSAFYDAELVSGTLDEGMPALALASVTAPLAVSDTRFSSDLDGDGQTDTFHWCTSAEGIHLTLWNGLPATGRREWHRYVYVGYDLDPTCTEAESRPDAP
jgi:hypothetical protein